MRSVNLRFLLLFCFLLIAGAGQVRAGEAPSMEKLSKQLEEIQARLDNIEKQQQVIITKEDDIRAELDRVRIWVHRK